MNNPFEGVRRGLVCVREPTCTCLGQGRAPSFREADDVYVYVLNNASLLQNAQTACCLWICDRSLGSGRGDIYCSYSFKSKVRTEKVAVKLQRVEVLKGMPFTNANKDVVCQVWVSQKEYRFLYEVRNGLVPQVQQLLEDVLWHKGLYDPEGHRGLNSFLEEQEIAIASEIEGFRLFKRKPDSHRLVHGLVRINLLKTTIEIVSPASRKWFGTGRCVDVPDLHTAVTHFGGGAEQWPLVPTNSRYLRFRDNANVDPPTSFHGSMMSPDHESADAEDADPFCSRAVGELLDPETVQDDDKGLWGDMWWEHGALKSLVRMVSTLVWPNGSELFELARRAALVLLSQASVGSPVADTFMETVTAVVQEKGSECLAVYKLVLALLDRPAVKQAALKCGFVDTLMTQYQMMTQDLSSSSSSSSEGGDDQDDLESHDVAMDLQLQPMFTGDDGNTAGGLFSLSQTSSDDGTMAANVGPTCSTPHAPLKTTSECGMSTYSLDVDLVESPFGSGFSGLVDPSPLAPVPGRDSATSHPELPKLTFYWLTKHDQVKAGTASTTRTTLSFPDGRTIVLDDDAEDVGVDISAVPQKGCRPGHFPQLSTGIPPMRNVRSVPLDRIAERTMHTWGVPAVGQWDLEASVAYQIKCIIMELFLGFSALNQGSLLEQQVHILEPDTNPADDDDASQELVRSDPSGLVVAELLTPTWLVYPGEQPPVRRGPSRRGSALALAVVHEFACRIPQELQLSPPGMRVFMPQEISGASYNTLIHNAKGRLAQLMAIRNLDECVLEETVSLINLLGDFISTSPASAQAQLVAYGCSDTVTQVEAALFQRKRAVAWPPAVVRVFHALLKLFRAMLERAGDVVLEEFLIRSLLERRQWRTFVFDYAKAVLFSDKLASLYDKHELACLRLAVFCYFTSLVKVVARQREGTMHESCTPGSVPTDCQFGRPVGHGSDILEHLSFLISTRDGLVPRVLRHNDWGAANGGPPLGGGLHAQVLLFLKAAFSVPHNTILAQSDVSLYYLDLHWTAFKKLYNRAAAKGSEVKPVCRLHLEVIREIVAHKKPFIYTHLCALGILERLAGEISIEGKEAMAVKLQSFMPAQAKVNQRQKQHGNDRMKIPQSAFADKKVQAAARPSGGQKAAAPAPNPVPPLSLSPAPAKEASTDSSTRVSLVRLDRKSGKSKGRSSNGSQVTTTKTCSGGSGQKSARGQKSGRKKPVTLARKSLKSTEAKTLKEESRGKKEEGTAEVSLFRKSTKSTDAKTVKDDGREKKDDGAAEVSLFRRSTKSADAKAVKGDGRDRKEGGPSEDKPSNGARASGVKRSLGKLASSGSQDARRIAGATDGKTVYRRKRSARRHKKDVQTAPSEGQTPCTLAAESCGSGSGSGNQTANQQKPRGHALPGKGKAMEPPTAVPKEPPMSACASVASGSQAASSAVFEPLECPLDEFPSTSSQTGSPGGDIRAILSLTSKPVVGGPGRLQPKSLGRHSADSRNAKANVVQREATAGRASSDSKGPKAALSSSKAGMARAHSTPGQLQNKTEGVKARRARSAMPGTLDSIAEPFAKTAWDSGTKVRPSTPPKSLASRYGPNRPTRKAPRKRAMSTTVLPTIVDKTDMGVDPPTAESAALRKSRSKSWAPLGESVLQVSTKPDEREIALLLEDGQTTPTGSESSLDFQKEPSPPTRLGNADLDSDGEQGDLVFIPEATELRGEMVSAETFSVGEDPAVDAGVPGPSNAVNQPVPALRLHNDDQAEQDSAAGSAVPQQDVDGVVPRLNLAEIVGARVPVKGSQQLFDPNNTASSITSTTLSSEYICDRDSSFTIGREPSELDASEAAGRRAGKRSPSGGKLSESEHNGPPTFGLVCRARANTPASSSVPNAQAGHQASANQDVQSAFGSEDFDGSTSPGSWQPPSDFEYTGDMSDDARRLERLERQHHGYAPSFDSMDTFSLPGSGRARPFSVPPIRMPGMEASTPQEGNPAKEMLRTSSSQYQDDQRSKTSLGFAGEDKHSRVPSIDSRGVAGGPLSGTVANLMYDFEMTGDASDDARMLDRMERRKRGETLSTMSSQFGSFDLSGSSDLAAGSKPIPVPPISIGGPIARPGKSRLRSRSRNISQQSVGSDAFGKSNGSPLCQRTDSMVSKASTFQPPSDFEYTGDVSDDARRLDALERRQRGLSMSTVASFSTLQTGDFANDMELEGHGKAEVPLLDLNQGFIQHTRQQSNLSGNMMSWGSISSEQTKSMTHVWTGVSTSNPFVSATNMDTRQPESLFSYDTKKEVHRVRAAADRAPTPPLPIGVAGMVKHRGGGAGKDAHSTKGPLSLAGMRKDHSLAGQNPKSQQSSAENGAGSQFAVMRRLRGAYQSDKLHAIILEILLEGMLLEECTRPARETDKPEAVQLVQKDLPIYLHHHLNHSCSRHILPVLRHRALKRNPRLFGLLRMLAREFFPSSIYKSSKRMGKGAFAQVHRCMLPVKGGPNTCAVKVEDLPAESNCMRTLMDMFSEVSILEQFRGLPCISQLFDYGITHDSMYMVMKEYRCSLLDWRKRLPARCPRALRLFLRIFRNVVEAVKILHEHNVVHFDLKCSNVLLDPLPGVEGHFWSPPTEELPFRVVLADFGEARSYSNSWEARTVRNRGTEFNKSPEMLLISNASKRDLPEFDRRKRQGAGQPCDVWALGCLLFEVVTGEVLQYDDDYARFFVRITRASLPVVDGERLRLLDLDSKSSEIVLDLLNFMLVRDQSWRPSLTMVERRLDQLMTSGSLPIYARPMSTGADDDDEPVPANVKQTPGIQLFGDIGELPLDIVKLTDQHVLARIAMVRDPWVLTENNITMVVLMRGGPPNAVTIAIRGAAARAQIELLELDLLIGLMESDPTEARCRKGQSEHEILSRDQINAVLERRSARVAMAAEAGYEKALLRLATAIVKEEESIGEFEAHLWIWRRLKQ